MRVAVPVMAAMLLLSVTGMAQAHRLDEYLQATMIGITRQRVAVTLRLTPGRGVAPAVIHQIDSNGDGTVSPDEQHAYATRMARGLEISLNGHALSLRQGEAVFPSIAAMQAGSGVIVLQYEATVALTPGLYHLAYVNHASGPDVVYLVNTLMPDDPAIHPRQQHRSVDQSSYGLEFSVTPQGGT